MAEGNGEGDGRIPFNNYSRKRDRTDGAVEDDEEEKSSKPDLGLGDQHKFERRPVAENVRVSDHVSPPTGSNDVPKRDENPFSFKHFLKKDSGSSSYHCTGARPKVYRTPTSESFNNGDETISQDADASPYGRNTGSRSVGNAELSSVLPDFVQDHLIVEQCYLGHSDNIGSPHLSVELEGLPDFAVENVAKHESPVSNCSGRHSRQWDEPKIDGSDLPVDTPCDLTGSTEQVSCRMGSIPLDLPSFSRSSVNGDCVPTTGGDVLPFDLPLAAEAGNDLPILVESSGTRNGSQLAEVGASKSLPDFLSDGPIHSGRHSDVVESSDNLAAEFSRNSISTPQSPEGQLQRLQGENERLRRELESSRRQLLDQTRRIQAMEKEMRRLQSKELDGTATLEKAIEQVEDDLKRSTRRAVLAENMVSRLKQDNKALQDEVGQLRQEIRELRYGGGATAAGVSASGFLNTEEQAQRLAQELRSAAGSAEASLRQLLTGVNNLRMIASTVENMHRIHDRTGDFLDIDDEPGPAL